MELYILDSLLRRDTVVDSFESLIWTEKFSDTGEFELVVISTKENRSRFQADTKLACNVSNRIMVVETTEDTVDNDNRFVLNVKGRTLESMLENRVANRVLTNTVTEPKWVLIGLPQDIVMKMFTDICVLGLLDQGDIIPYVQPGNMYPTDNIPWPTQIIRWEQEPAPLYDAIKKLCDLYDLGFRITRDGDSSKLYFNVYSGNDRTAAQNILPAVVFSPELDSLQNTTELRSIEKSKNVAYVFSPAGALVVFPDAVNPDLDGFERRVLMVNATDITQVQNPDANNPLLTPAQINALLSARGKQELSKHRSFAAFDGELNQYNGNVYDVAYSLGDLITMRNVDGASNSMRVTEQIFVQDQNGERSYPTLTINLFIYPGSWESYNFEVWRDFGATEYWSTQP